MHTPLRLRQYRHMPLGLVDLGATMQQCIQQTLEGIDGVVIYIDDILIFAKMKEAHDAILWKVLRHLHAKDFRLQLKKCQFGKHSISFLGQILSQDQIRWDPANVEAISNIPTSTMFTLICSFLGTVQHYLECCRLPL